MKTLCRSSRHKVLFGVCGGLAEYFGVDPVAIRIIMILLGLMGFGILFYIAAIIIMPPERIDAEKEQLKQPANSTVQNFSIWVGAILVIVGFFVLLANFGVLQIHHIWKITESIIIPCVVIALGIGVLIRRKRSQHPSVSDQPNAPLEQAPLRSGQWYRSRRDRKLLGVCCGIAYAMDLDPTVVRLAWVVLSMMSLGLGIFLYVILALVLPEEPLSAQS